MLLTEEPDTRISINIGVPSIADLEWFNHLARHALHDDAGAAIDR
jgi:hypothetical protein